MTIGTEEGKVEGSKHGQVAHRTLQLRDDQGHKAGGGGAFRDRSLRVFYSLCSFDNREIFRTVNHVIERIFNYLCNETVFIKQRLKEKGKFFVNLIIHNVSILLLPENVRQIHHDRDFRLPAILLIFKFLRQP